MFKIKKIYFLGLWVIPAILSTNSFYLRDLVNNKSTSWLSVFFVQLLVWLLWAGFTPFILFLSRKFRIERPHRLIRTLFHAITSIVFVLIYLALYTYILGMVNQVTITLAWFKGTYVNIYIAVNHWAIMIYWSILGIGYAFEYYNKFREREVHASQLERQLVEVQLQTLKTQLQPHFLFNTLHTIGSLVRHDKKETAVKMLAGLSDLLRLSLDNVGKQEILLNEELEFLKLYLDIQKVRFQDRLNVQMKIAPETLDALVPVFILQPIVENAIRHGFDKHRKAGSLEIHVLKENDALRMEVYNEGPALAKNWHLSQTEGVGLRNTCERLKQLYGEDAKLELKNAETGGVLTTIILPHKTESDEEKE